MHNPESVLVNERHKILWDFDIQTDHLISTRRLHLLIINKKKKREENLPNCGLCCPGWPQNKIKRKRKENDGDTNCHCWSWFSHQMIGTKTGGLGNNGTGGDYPNYSIIKIGPNTKKNPGDLRRLAVTPVENHQLTLVWKTLIILWDLEVHSAQKITSQSVGIRINWLYTWQKE